MATRGELATVDMPSRSIADLSNAIARSSSQTGLTSTQVSSPGRAGSYESQNSNRRPGPAAAPGVQRHQRASSMTNRTANPACTSTPGGQANLTGPAGQLAACRFNQKAMVPATTPISGNQNSSTAITAETRAHDISRCMHLAGLPPARKSPPHHRGVPWPVGGRDQNQSPGSEPASQTRCEDGGATRHRLKGTAACTPDKRGRPRPARPRRPEEHTTGRSGTASGCPSVGSRLGQGRSDVLRAVTHTPLRSLAERWSSAAAGEQSAGATC